MCTVTFIARKTGFALGMNRDEKLTRPLGRPPAIERIGSRRALFPSEPGGGTWIGVNNSGVCFALINWYSVSTRVMGHAVSRGEIVRSALVADSITSAQTIVSNQPLTRVNPFRLIGFFSADKTIREWRWDLKTLQLTPHSWKTQTWISSGFDEIGAQKSRGKTFADALRQKSAGTLPWLRRLHRSHQPGCGPYSTCMHRTEAATVSYTEVIVSSRQARLAYQAASPCKISDSLRSIVMSVTKNEPHLAEKADKPVELYRQHTGWRHERTAEAVRL